VVQLRSRAVEFGGHAIRRPSRRRG